MLRPSTACALLSFVLTGLAPIYWKQLHEVSSVQVSLHRILWAFLLLFVVFVATQSTAAIHEIKTTPISWRFVGRHILSSFLLVASLYLTVAAVAASMILDLSLGLFLAPLVALLCQLVSQRDAAALRHWQWLSIALACVGVVADAIAARAFPAFPLSIALTTGAYAYLKKTAANTSTNHSMKLVGETLELGLASIPALVVLVMTDKSTLTFLHGLPWTTDVLLVGGGVVLTACPLLLLAQTSAPDVAAILAVLQFTTPVVQFVVGVVGYGEACGLARLAGFGLVWISLYLFTAYNTHSEKPKTPTTAANEKGSTYRSLEATI
ncbi:Aste57867_17832 [Aphanomyces stellatus]|uniref:Aste57867_17832 protein n=1 Tax=Aphanomyces stellatus TaxID=120398 RepID=A0A485LA87_9STRA|nr:hypothetical protein As57867_017771 [Aphanomyces stellatus]VFT94575.1 Aste57867_17832 [Aphanomyces stellatus]